MSDKPVLSKSEVKRLKIQKQSHSKVVCAVCDAVPESSEDTAKRSEAQDAVAERACQGFIQVAKSHGIGYALSFLDDDLIWKLRKEVG